MSLIQFTPVLITLTPTKKPKPFFYLSPNDKGFRETFLQWHNWLGDQIIWESRRFQLKYHCHHQKQHYRKYSTVSTVSVTRLGCKWKWTEHIVRTSGTGSLTLLMLNTSDNWRWILNTFGQIMQATGKLWA